MSNSYDGGVLLIRSRPARFPHVRLPDVSRQSPASAATATASRPAAEEHRELITTNEFNAHVLGDNRDTNRFRWMAWTRRGLRGTLTYADLLRIHGWVATRVCLELSWQLPLALATWKLLEWRELVGHPLRRHLIVVAFVGIVRNIKYFYFLY